MSGFDRAISKVTGVALMVALVVVIAGLIGVLVLTGFELESTSSAGVTLDQGEVKVIEMGNSEKLLIKENGTVINQLNSTGDSIEVNGGEKVIAVSEKGDRSFLRRINKKQVIDSGGNVYTEIPENLDPDNFTLSTDKYTGGEDRILGTTESFQVDFKKNYNKEKFTYQWRISPPSGWGDWYNWGADISEEGYKATYKYDSTSPSSVTASTEVIIKAKGSGDSISIKSSKYNVVQPIRGVKFKSKEEFYSNNRNRIIGTQENYKITTVNLHPKVSELDSVQVPDEVENYQWKGWSIDNPGWGDWYFWGADISEEGYKATYKYDSTSPGNIQASPKVYISVPGLDVTQSFIGPSYNVVQPIKNVKFKSKNFSSSVSRNVSDIEVWEVTKINLHTAVSELPSVNVPENIKNYQWEGWGINPSGSWGDWYSWRADINENNASAVYDYTRESRGEIKSGAEVTVSVPGLDTRQNFKTYNYIVRDK